MNSMEVVQTFNNELQSLIEIKPPVSKVKMGLITRAAMKGVKFYKHIVQVVEKFISKCAPEYKIPGLYVIDSIVRQSRHQFGIERDVYAVRFSRNLQTTFSHLFAGCSVEDKPKIVRVLNLWQKNGVFNSQVIQPLLDMANPNSAPIALSESSLSVDSPTNNTLESKHGQNSKYHMHRFGGSSNNSQFVKSSSSSVKHRSSEIGVAGGLKFNKNMLDFDYDEDDDDDGDETPTEAEPPLSSTLSKIELEQRNRGDLSNSSYQSSLLNQQQQSGNSNQLNLRNEDPVLQRWNRLIKNQTTTSENSNNNDYQSMDRHQRHRSRSPPPRPVEKYLPPVKEQTQTPTPVKIVTPKTTVNSAEKEAERQRKSLPPIRDKHLTVCSSTLWLGHVPKTVSEADISNAFGEFGTINSIDLIPPRGCAYVCMDRRQDAKRALSESKDLKLNGSHIKMAWAPGKGFKEYKKLKDFWEVSTGSSYIPYGKIDASIDFDTLEEGGVIDEDSMSMEMRETRERKAKEKENKANTVQSGLNLPLPALPILTQPPPFTIPPPNLSIPPPAILGQAPGLGGIPFPPPSVTTSNQMPPQTQKLFDHQESQERDNVEALNSPNAIDQQLSMTERQINMVEQQLSMIQHAQGMSQSRPTLPHMHPQAIYHQTQPNPMIFDLAAAQMLHVGPHLLDQQQIPIFSNPPPQLFGQPPQILPTSQANMNPNMNGNSMTDYSGRYYE